MQKNWTGERLETFVFNETTVEHLHRYGMVLPICNKKVVLDIACGEGYGSKLISSIATEVIGVDIDDDVIQKAIKKYNDPKLTFLQGSADRIPVDNAVIDIVISFETIEHHDKHLEMIEEVKRVLKPGGKLIISSPEKTGEVSFNEFHLKELSKNEFINLISSNFKFCNFYNQKLVHGSLIVPIESNNNNSFEYLQGNFEKINSFNEIPNYVYNICIASDSGPVMLPFSFFDGSDILLQNILFAYKNSRLYRLSSFFKKIWFKKK